MNHALAKRLGLLPDTPLILGATTRSVGDALSLMVDSSRVSWHGRVFLGIVPAFEHIAFPFLDAHYRTFFDLDDEGDDDEARPTIVADYADFRGRPDDVVFALDHFEVNERAQGVGIGRMTISAIERALAERGVDAVLLQAGQLGHRHSFMFWRKMGYKTWPGDYGIYDDRIMVKHLRWTDGGPRTGPG